MSSTKQIHIKIIAALLAALLVSAAFALPIRAHAQDAGKIVRVGWYESPFNHTDELDRRSGYAYDYQQKLAAYTGWTYEYVQGSWPELLQMLIDGRIDLLSDVSFTEERAEKILYSSLPMGAEEYYIFVSPRNQEITPEDFSTFNGKKVGGNKGSVQLEFFRQWAEANGVRAEIVEMTGLEEENITKLNRGAIDLYVSIDGFHGNGDAVPICKVGASDFYFAVSKARPELLVELNQAMSRIMDEDQFYNQKLYSKYLESSKLNRYLSAEESAWLADHGPIRVGYRDNYLAFCAKDPETGELTGALAEYLRVASDCLENVHLDFEPVAYPTSEDAMAALKKGEVDCMFPANLTNYDGETQGVFITPALMRTDMSAVIRETDLQTFAKKERVAVAVNIGNPNYDIFLLDHFPEWRAVYFESTPECLKAISEGQADCLLISHYRFNNIASLCEKYKLTTISTGVEMDDCLAVNRQDTTLYSILTKTTGAVPSSTINAALTHYFTEDAKVGFFDLIKRNMSVTVGVLIVSAAAFLFMILRSLWAKKKVAEGRRLISETETDTLTGLYNRDYFYAYADRMYREHPDKPMDAVALDIEQFYSISALYGQSFSSQTLRVLGREILSFAQETGGIATREELDHFTIYCPHDRDRRALFDRLQGVLDSFAPNVGIRLCMGVMPWQANTEPQQMFEQARFAWGLARGSSREHLVVFDDKMRERVELEQRLRDDLPRALENREFEVYYQPKLDIRNEAPRFKSAEALVRWRHPKLGVVMPDDFLSLAERNGQIGALDKFVWAEAARQIAAWRKKYGVTIPFSVNLSHLDVCDPTLKSTLDAIMEENGLDHGVLNLELTETVCAENDYRVMDTVEALRKDGYKIGIDDFGSGWSSLKMLSSTEIDMLNLDRTLVSEIEFRKQDVQLAELILELARKLNIPVVAEGVETESQLRILKEMGCDMAQGFYFSKPLPADEFEAAYVTKKG